MLTPAQQEYFKDSVVRNANGDLLTVYHGTQAEFDAFDGGAFLTDDYFNASGYACGENVIEAYINIKNPLIIDCAGAKWDDLDTEYGTSTREVVATVDSTQYDGVIFQNINDYWFDDEVEEDEDAVFCTVYYVFNPNQIKSIDNLYPTLSDNFIEAENVPQEELSLKDIQMQIIQEFNPMLDDYHTGIRSVEDIKTFEEAMQDDESFVYGDFEYEDAQKALETGKVTVYSSKPIEQGGFVSTSYNMAKDYAGGGKVYSKEVNLEDVAWINGDEGQYANIQEYELSKPQSLDDLIAAAGEPDSGFTQHSRDDREDR